MYFARQSTITGKTEIMKALSVLMAGALQKYHGVNGANLTKLNFKFWVMNILLIISMF